jgi:hypothetical protein
MPRLLGSGFLAADATTAGIAALVGDADAEEAAGTAALT